MVVYIWFTLNPSGDCDTHMANLSVRLVCLPYSAHHPYSSSFHRLFSPQINTLCAPVTPLFRVPSFARLLRQSPLCLLLAWWPLLFSEHQRLAPQPTLGIKARRRALKLVLALGALPRPTGLQTELRCLVGSRLIRQLLCIPRLLLVRMELMISRLEKM